jgi:parallel beta-helix repeat protein
MLNKDNILKLIESTNLSTKKRRIQMKPRLLIIGLILGLIGLFSFVNPTYSAISPTPKELASSDLDKDGYSDLCETLHKSDANNAESIPSSNVTINVPSDTDSIQEAINSAIDGDTIAVSEGTYKGNIYFKGKSLTLTSDSANTIIEGTESGSVVTIDSNSTLKGFTITSNNIDCRGIYVKDASPVIENCIITGNETTQSGAGIYSTEESSPKITNCIITGNKDSSAGESAQIAGGGTPEISISLINGQGLVDSTGTSTLEDSSYQTTGTGGGIHGIKWDDYSRNGVYGQLELIVFVIDISGSMTGLLETEKEAFTAVNQELIDIGAGSTVDVAIVTFNASGYQLDMDPVTSGMQYSTKAEADMDSSGTPDVEEILESLSDGGMTNFKAALQTTIDTIDVVGTTYDETCVIFMSDGGHEPSFGSFENEAELLRGKARYIRAFSVDEEPNEYMTIIDENVEMYVDPQTMLDSLYLSGILGNEELPLEGVTIYLDLNESGELDTGDISTTTNTEGQYSFTGLPADTYIVREVLPDGWLQTFPAGDGSHIVELDSDEIVYDINFGNYSSACTSKAIWHVDNNAPDYPPGDGKSWDTAFKYLQDALLNNVFLKAGDEIWVAEGAYKPDQGDGISTGDRTATFQLVNGVTIKGGYAGLDYQELGALNPYARDIANYETILSGDLGGNDGDPPDFDYYGDNSYTVVTGPDGGTIETVIDGFTIKGGHAQNNYWSGGGMLNLRAPFLTIKNCIFKDNYAFLYPKSSYHNSGYGGAIDNINAGISPYNPSPHTIKIVNCFFVNNAAGDGGGAIFNLGSSPIELINCVFTGNSNARGGTIYTQGSKNNPPKLTNCTFYNNSGFVAGICIYHSNPIITNCIFWDYGIEIFNGQFSRDTLCNPIITSCDIKGCGGSGPSWNTSIGTDGGGNIDSDPLFVNPSNPAGVDGIFCTFDDGLQLAPQSGLLSLCIDVANDDTAPITDILGNQRVDVPGVGNDCETPPADIGAYEFKWWTTLRREFSQPFGIHYDNTPGEGYIYVTDGDQRVVKTKIDGTGWTTYGTYGDDEGEFCWPLGIYYDSDSEYIYVADGGNDRIVKMKVDGTEITEWTPLDKDPENPSDTFAYPFDIYYDSDSEYIYVADTDNHRIVKTKIDGTGWTTLGGFSYPESIYYDSASEYIYVADTNNNRIVKTKIDGTGWTTLGGFSYPEGIYYDSASEYIYVADADKNSIVKTNIEATEWYEYGAYGDEDGEFDKLSDVYYDSVTGYIYVADRVNDRIVRVLPDWQ